jgi:hypothetical protein
MKTNETHLSEDKIHGSTSYGVLDTYETFSRMTIRDYDTHEILDEKILGDTYDDRNQILRAWGFRRTQTDWDHERKLELRAEALQRIDFSVFETSLRETILKLRDDGYSESIIREIFEYLIEKNLR